ncbi:MAG: outer membrane protein assembly factor BamE [Alphaproteobacteria bacterium]|nr:outer membrane protein assembly factor BamE [Alphaproteobacteria bacterium]
MKIDSSFLRSVAFIGLAAMTAACAPTVNVRGNTPEDNLISAIRAGVTTRDQVRDQLGSPSSIATFDDNVWYYISKKTEQVAFFTPKVLEQRVVVLRFNDTGRVAEIKKLTLPDAVDVSLVVRETPTAGHNLTLMEQLVGNLGRFNQGERRAGRPSGGF